MHGMSHNSSEQLSKREQVALSILLQAVQRGDAIKQSHVKKAYRLADEFLNEGEGQEEKGEGQEEKEEEEEALFWHLWRDEQFAYMQLSKDPTVCFHCPMRDIVPNAWVRGRIRTPIQNSIKLGDAVSANKAVKLLQQAENKDEENNNSSEASHWLIWKDMYLMDKDYVVYLQQSDDPKNCWSFVVDDNFGDSAIWRWHKNLEMKPPSNAHKLKIMPTPERAWEILSQEPDGTEKAPNATSNMWTLWHDSGSLHLRRVEGGMAHYSCSLKDHAVSGWNRTFGHMIGDYAPPVGGCYFLDFFPDTKTAVSIYNCSENTKNGLWLVWKERSLTGDVVRAQPVGIGDGLFSCWCRLNISKCEWIYSAPRNEMRDSVPSVGFPSVHEACRLLLGNNNK